VNGRLVLVAVAVSAVVLCCGGGAVAVAVGAMIDGGGSSLNLAACQAGQGPSFRPVGAVAGFSPDQVANAAVIVHVGQSMNVPPRGWVVAVATAMQESTLHNSSAMRDHDSVGLFQQRPSKGWGTVAQIMDPQYSSRKFYERLVKVPGWLGLPLTKAAQIVQRSAFPGAYAKHEVKAAALVDQVAGAPVTNVGSGTDGCATAGEVTASGWTAPVKGAHVGSPFGPRDGRLHAGVDLIIGKHNPIFSVADGTVIKAVCDVGNCDRDGSPSTRGCGWYVDIRHAGGIISRYCHQLVRPLVVAGQHVSAGQQIGWSGTSGHSSGPHVHFEIHTNNDEHAATGAINPVPFMRSKGVSLGDDHV
jgi:murein DD-endopeptidase MepM/ murein hydrolase activator NlpD